MPREVNRAADFLAGKAIAERQDRMFVNYRWRSFGGRAVVGVSDAGVREAVGGEHVGMGWMLVDRETKECIVAAQWYRWAAEPEGRRGHREDVNFWEARAAKACLAAVVALRAGRLGEVARSSCDLITTGGRRGLKRQLGDPLGS